MAGSLSEQQRRHFEEFGWLMLPGLLSPERDFRPLIAEYEQVLDSLVDELRTAGELDTDYRELPFADRVTAVFAAAGRDLTQHFDFSLPQSSTKADTPYWTGPAVFALLRHPAILDAVESLIGGEIYSNPVQHVRLKVPEQLMPPDPKTGRPRNVATPWHQDNGVVTAEADTTEMITVWIPLQATDPANGCLMLQPRRHDSLLPHCPGDSPMGIRVGGGPLRIPGFHLAGETIDAPMAAGDVLLLHRRTPHAAHRNTSDRLRWSFDLRYQPVGQPTGRSAFPGFVARSRTEPESELRDPDQWAESWRSARAALSSREAVTFNRWDSAAAACA